MTHVEKRKQFLEDFKKIYPNYKIINFKGIAKPIVFEDENGFLHKKCSARRALTHKIGVESVVNKLSYIQFQAKKINPNIKVLEYTGGKENLLIEDENGFQYVPQCYDFLQGHPVSIQTCTKKEELFKYKANNLHNNYYSYPDFIYKNGKQKINIKCPVHGEFKQSIEGHLWGNGCKKCNGIGFSKESWLRRLKNKEALFYIIEMKNKEESFIKIGITSLNVKLRYKNFNTYDYTIIDIIKGNPSYIYDLEKKLLKKFKKYRYMPKTLFQGYTECFTNNIIEKYEQFKKQSSESC